MSLSGYRQQQIQAALLESFSEGDLRQLIRFELNQDFDQIVGSGNLQARVFQLVEWTLRHGCTGALIAGALRQNTTSPALIALAESAAAWHLDTPAQADRAPYKGLEFYDVADADLFFGRTALVADLLDYLKTHYFLAIVGASGSGKSSLVRAGLMAALQQKESVQGREKWAIHLMKPGPQPLRTLAAALTPPQSPITAQTALLDELHQEPGTLAQYAARLSAQAGAPRLLLVVDQFEELFTLCNDADERRAFVDNLLMAANASVALTLVISLRADFYAQCAQFENLRLALQTGQQFIGRMTADELRAVIERPAAAGNWDLEPGLADQLLQDVSDQPGSLTLLSYALLETWRRRSGRLLMLAAYVAVGGVQGALPQTADAVYAQLTSEQQFVARNVFVRLTSLGDGVQDTRRRVALDELVNSPQSAAIQTVLEQLQVACLVVAERDPDGCIYVEVAHEAIIREWPRLRIWLDEDRAGLRIQRRLTKAEQEWTELQQDPSLLLRGTLLAQIAEWAEEHPNALNEREAAFLAQSQFQVDAERSAREREQQEREDALRLRAQALQTAVQSAEALAMEQKRLAAVEQQRSREQAEAARLLKNNNRVLRAVAALAATAAVLASFFFVQAQTHVKLADAQLRELESERLVGEGRRLRAALDTTGAISAFEAAAASDPSLIVLSDEINATLRYVAMQYVQAGERILCRAVSVNSDGCGALAEADTTASSVSAIEARHLAWAEATAPQLEGWSDDVAPLQRQAIISATALFSQALSLQPPPDTPVYVWLPPGTFVMGSTDEQCRRAGLDECFPEEQPPHAVELGGYWLQRVEVSNAQYKRCYESGGCPEPPDNSFWDLPRWASYPVTNVDWHQAIAYATWVGGRLPMEAEWEYACRSSDARIYPWGDETPTTARLNYNNEVNGTSELGAYAAGANGLYDMAGNVWEWALDPYVASYAEQAAGGSEARVGLINLRALRGGAWNDDSADARCALRYATTLDSGGEGVGLRVLAPDLLD